MGIDFDVNVDIKTNGKDQVDTLEKQIENLKKLPTIKIDVDVVGKNGTDLSKLFNNIEKQAQASGKTVANNFQQGIKSVKFNGDTFYKQYFNQARKDIKEAERVQTDFSKSLSGLSTKGIDKNALKAVRAANKEISALQKQQEKAYNKNLEQTRSAENAQKRILAQQRIAEMKSQAIQKNAHANELVQQGKDNISKWSQQYDKQYRENQKAYFKQVEEYNKRELEYVQKRKEYETQGKKQAQEDADGRALVSAYKDASEYQKRETEYLKLRNQYIAEGKKQEQEYYLEQKKQQKINEQNIAQTRANEESKKRIQAQQQIAELKSNAIQKNAHNNELVQQGKDNIVKWKQQYNEKQKDADGLALVEAYKQASEYQQKESEYLKLRNQYLAEGKKQEQEYYSKQQKFSQLDAVTASNKTLAWLKNNSKAAKDYGDILTDLAHKQSLATNSDDLKKYTKQVNAIKAEATALGKTGKSFFEETGNAFKRIGQFAYTYGVIQQIPNAIAESVNELKQMDDILTEISKTSDLTTSQLKELGSTSFDSASKYGKKASDYLTGIQEMSRSGYYGEQAKQMANLSVLAQAAGDIDANMANSYLLASNAAYQYQGNVEKLNALLDGQNMINRMVMPCRKLMAS